MQEAPRLSHVGLYVHDVPKMIDFYTKVLGFVVSDGAEDGRITFLSRNPSSIVEFERYAVCPVASLAWLSELL